MAIKYLDGGRITGLSTDAKPDRDTSDSTSPALTVQAGSVFIETDTGSKYVHNGTAWIPLNFEDVTPSISTQDTEDVPSTYVYVNNQWVIKNEELFVWKEFLYTLPITLEYNINF